MKQPFLHFCLLALACFANTFASPKLKAQDGGQQLLSTNYAAKAFEALGRSTSSVPSVNPQAEALAKESLKSASLLFIENKGQVVDTKGMAHPEILFTARTGGAQVYVTGNSIHYVFTKVERAERPKSKEGAGALPDLRDRDSIKSVSTHRFTMELVGANAAPELLKQKDNPYYENYYLAQCPNGVVAHSYEKFTLRDVYPGVDWVVYSNGQGLKYDFVLAKGSDASKIKLRVKDAQSSMSKEGELVINTTIGKVVEDKPISYQGEAKLATNFVELGNQTYGFNVDGANVDLPLTIDPSVAWATYYGGIIYDRSFSCSMDVFGDIYMAGLTRSSNFPVFGGFISNHPGWVNDAFLVKFSPTGNRLWATFYGGSDDDAANSCTTDLVGNVFIVGSTNSTNLPVFNAFQTTFAGGDYDVMLVKFSKNGNPIWATYYGGSLRDVASSCVTDMFGNVYLVGYTNSPNFPIFSAFQTALMGADDCLAIKFSPSGSCLWATYYGGSGMDTGYYCAMDMSGNLYLACWTYSSDLPTIGAFQPSKGGGTDSYIAKISSVGIPLWSTYYGGSDDEIGRSCNVDAAGNIYLVGSTKSLNFPLSNGLQGPSSGFFDAFIVKFSPAGIPTWSRILGSSNEDIGMSCAFDLAGNVYLLGCTKSVDFPILGSAFQVSYGGGNYDSFASKYSDSGSLLWNTYLGGVGEDLIWSAVADAYGNIYVTGLTMSNNFPTFGAFQGTYAGNYDAFMVKIFDCTPPQTPVITSNGPIVMCTDGSVRLSAPTGFFYLWSNDSTTQSIEVSRSGTFTVRTVAGSCTSAISSPLSVHINNQPQAPTIQRNSDTLEIVNPTGATVQWLLNNAPIPGATSVQYVATSIGTYTVRLTSSQGCAVLSPPLSVVTDLASDKNLNLHLYPNPADNELILSLEGVSGAVSVSIVGADGRSLPKMKMNAQSGAINQTIPVGYLAQGVWMVEITLPNGTIQRRRFVKQ